MEKEILRMMMQEKSGNEIAKALNLSITQVDALRKGIYKKTNTTSPIGLAKAAFNMGIIKNGK